MDGEGSAVVLVTAAQQRRAVSREGNRVVNKAEEDNKVVEGNRAEAASRVEVVLLAAASLADSAEVVQLVAQPRD